MGNKKPTQAQRVLDYITEHGSITQLEAASILGVWRLASRIADLKKNGYVFEHKRETVKTRYGKAPIVRYSFRAEGAKDENIQQTRA